MKRKREFPDNYLERKPMRSEHINWSADKEGMVTLDVEHNGVFHRITQKLLHKPKVTHIHLDEMGSFVWPLLDGKINIITLGILVEERFGEKALPLYERLAKFFQILDSHHFIEWKY